MTKVAFFLELAKCFTVFCIIFLNNKIGVRVKSGEIPYLWYAE